MDTLRVRWRWLLTGMLVLMGVQVADFILIGSIKPDWGEPDLSLASLVLDVALAAGAVLVVMAFPRATEPRPLTRAQRRTVLAVLAFVSTFVLLWVAAPDAYRWLGQEDGVLEWGQTAAFLVGAVLVHRHALRLRREGQRSAWILGEVLALGMVVFAGEEVSWGQRLLGVEATGIFAGNYQGETNLHNFATGALELVYFSGTSALLVALPLAWRLGGLDRLVPADRLRALRPWIPAPWIALVVAPAAAIVWSYWNAEPIQAMFTMSIAALLWFWTTEGDRFLVRAIVGVMVATVVITFATGETLILSRIDEVREAVIAVGVMAHALTLGRP